MVSSVAVTLVTFFIVMAITGNNVLISFVAGFLCAIIWNFMRPQR